jgi:hypothetical protein
MMTRRGGQLYFAVPIAIELVEIEEQPLPAHHFPPQSLEFGRRCFNHRLFTAKPCTLYSRANSFIVSVQYIRVAREPTSLI